MEYGNVNVSEIIRFVIVGVINTLFTVAVIYISMAMGWNLYLANALGYGCGLAISFTLNRNWTFGSQISSGPDQLVKFAAAVALSYTLNIITVRLCLADGAQPYIAQLAGMPAYTLSFYILSKTIVFKK